MNDAKPSYEELEARAACMREALEEVWALCSKEHWPGVGRALEGGAGEETLRRLRAAERGRNLLAAAIRPLAEALESNDALVAEAVEHSAWIPDSDDDPVEVDIRLGPLRTARAALEAVEATPERVRVLEDALRKVESYADLREGSSLPTGPTKARILHILKEEIPSEVARALEFGRLRPPPRDPAEEELARKAHDYEWALGEIVRDAGYYNDDQQEHELCHALQVELSDVARQVLDEYREPEPDTQHEPDDPWWIPF